MRFIILHFCEGNCWRFKIPNMHSCFSDMADKKRRKVNSFRNTNYGNQLSKVVKLITKWVMDALKREKIWQCFSLYWYSSDDKWRQSERKSFYLKKAGTKFMYLDNFDKDPCLVWFWDFFAEHHQNFRR